MNILELRTETENEKVRDYRSKKNTYYTDDELRGIGKEFCSHGDKVYADPIPKVFRDCHGVYIAHFEGSLYYLDTMP